MAKVKTTNPPAAEPALPDLGAEPDVAAARAKRDELRADLAAVRGELATLDADARRYRVPAKISPAEVEARRIAGDAETAAVYERLSRRPELRDREAALARAAQIAGEACDAIERRTAARLAPAAIAAVYAPKARAAALAYLAAIAAVEAANDEYRRVYKLGFSAGLRSPFHRPLPLTTEFGNGLPKVLASLVADGHLTRDEVAAALPVLVARNAI